MISVKLSVWYVPDSDDSFTELYGEPIFFLTDRASLLLFDVGALLTLFSDSIKKNYNNEKISRLTVELPSTSRPTLAVQA